MRMLFTSTAGTGHVLPLLPVAVAARRAGHDVRWALAEPARPTVQRAGIHTVAAGMSVPERIGGFLDRFGAAMAEVPPPERRTLAFTGHFAHLCAPRMASELRPIVAEWQPDLLVHETAELAGPLLAESMGIPHANVAFSGEVPRPARVAAAAALAPLRAELGLPPSDDLELTGHTYFHPFAPSMGQRPAGPGVHELRPTDEDAVLAGRAPEWVDAVGVDRPLVYVTFGTEMGPLAPWPMLAEALASLRDTDVVITVGGAVDPAQLDGMPPHVRVERYVPQGWLLPRCSLVVSHAGAGTLLAAAREGVPQLLLPLGADQFENTAAYLSTGAGASGFGLDAHGVGSMLRMLLGDEEHRAAAAALAAEFDDMPGPDDAVRVLESLGTGREP